MDRVRERGLESFRDQRVQFPEECRECLPRASRSEDQCVGSTGDSRPARTLRRGGFAECVGEPLANERVKGGEGVGGHCRSKVHIVVPLCEIPISSAAVAGARRTSHNCGMSKGDLRHTFTAALDGVITEVKKDRAILAAILCGSLSHDTVWEKSDIDLVLITIDDKMAESEGKALYADGVNVHSQLIARTEFR